jgi:hypothetical protein
MRALILPQNVSELSLLALAGVGMCEKCGDIDAKLARYERLAAIVIDHGALESIERLIANLVAERAYLHSRSPLIRAETPAAVIDFGEFRTAKRSRRLSPVNLLRSE